MRKLTIKRAKSFVASLTKVKVYIEDQLSNELTINNVPCRKLGNIKNGEEATFDIGDNSAKVFVICDKLSKNYCNDFYQLEAGTDDIVLTGKNKYNPVTGNAFRFDNNNTPEAAANRKKGKKKGLIVILVAVLIGGVIGFFGGFNSVSSPDSPIISAPQEKTFTCEGMSIVLTDDFRESSIESNYTVLYDSPHVALFALKEEFYLFDGSGIDTLEQYGQAVLNSNSMTDISITEADGLNYFSYEAENPDTNVNYKYYSFLFKATDAFWMVQFATVADEAELYSEQIFDWAKTIRFE